MRDAQAMAVRVDLPETATQRALRLFSHHDVAHGPFIISVGGHDDVETLHDALEGLVEVLLLQLQLQESAVHLVQKGHRLDALSNGLPQHCLCLHTHTCKANGREKSRDDQVRVWLQVKAISCCHGSYNYQTPANLLSDHVSCPILSLPVNRVCVCSHILNAVDTTPLSVPIAFPHRLDLPLTHESAMP